MIRNFSYLFYSLLIFSLSISVPCYAENTLDKNAPVILIMGDSLSASHKMPTSKGWVALLEKRLSTENFPHRVINASISGETSSGGLNRLPSALDKHQPDIVVIELGGNDGLRGLPLTLMQKNLQHMISTAQNNQAHVLLLGMRLPPSYGPQYTKNFAQVFADIAQQNNIRFVPFFLVGVGTEASLMQSDGLHPNVAAQHYLLETVWPNLLPLLKEPPIKEELF